MEKNNLLNYINTDGGLAAAGAGAVARTSQAASVFLAWTAPAGNCRIRANCNFDPRLGVAYSLNNKTIIHAGAGIFHHPAAAWQQYPERGRAPSAPAHRSMRRRTE